MYFPQQKFSLDCGDSLSSSENVNIWCILLWKRITGHSLERRLEKMAIGNVCVQLILVWEGPSQEWRHLQNVSFCILYFTFLVYQNPKSYWKLLKYKSDSFLWAACHAGLQRGGKCLWKPSIDRWIYRQCTNIVWKPENISHQVRSRWLVRNCNCSLPWTCRSTMKMCGSIKETWSRGTVKSRKKISILFNTWEFKSWVLS